MPIEILAHRGFPQNDNSFDSLKNAFDNGFGIETDVRDSNGFLVISHDPPNKGEELLTLEDLFKYYSDHNLKSTLALNIKSSGLEDLLLQLLTKYKIFNYFCFDLTIPDMLNYYKKVKYYIRFSEVEPINSLIMESDGIWVDLFKPENTNFSILDELATNNKSLAFVSPELHGENYLKYWQHIVRLHNLYPDLVIYICTDIPQKFKEILK